MPGIFRIRKWLEPPVGLADSPRGACRHCFAMPGVLSAFPYSRFARIPGPAARLMTQSLCSEGVRTALFQDLLGMVLCIDLLDDFSEDSVLVEDEGAAKGSHDCLSVHLLLSPCSEGLEHLCGSIGQ